MTLSPKTIHFESEYSGKRIPGGLTLKRERFCEEQIIGILKESEAGGKNQRICGKHGISESTFYRWRSKYGGLQVSEASRPKQLESENRKLKQLLAETRPDRAALKELLSEHG